MGEPGGASISVNLASEPDFALGAVVVEPSVRQIVVRGERQTLEPRVMQVLVALARANGAVVSRDALIDRCWDGRIVSEAAINRVISRLRQVATDAGDDGFRIETITKVGYRLSDAGVSAPGTQPEAAYRVRGVTPEADPPPPRAAIPRRALIGGGAALAAAAGFGFWQATSGDRQRASKARSLVEMGRRTTLLEGADERAQAIAYLREATQVDPASAEAWGALALALTDERGSRTEPADLPVWADRCRSAARRALELDPGNADAQVALASVSPTFRNWAKQEAAFRALRDRYPDHFRVRHRYAYLLTMTGRHSDAVGELRRVREQAPLFGIARQLNVLALWTAGRVEEAEQELDAAYRIWPATFWIWIQRFNFLALSGRASEALAQAASNDRPTFPWPAEISLTSARALAYRDPTEVARAVDLHVAASRNRGFPFFVSTLYLSALGDLDAAFALTRNRLLGEPAIPGAPPVRRSPLQDPPTSHLFMRPAAPMRADARFEPLIRTIGLDHYWRAAGIVPDYRKAR